MDLVTLSYIVAVLVGLLGMDTVLHPAGVVVEASISAKYERVAVDPDTISAILNATVASISSTPSVNAAPEIRVGGAKGIGMAVAEALKMQPLALALQYEFGHVPEQIRIAILAEDGTTKILVSGSGLGGHIRTPPFEELLTLNQGESLVQLVQRAAIVGLGRIDPYFTALHLIRKHAETQDFREASALIDKAIVQFPPTPVSVDRARFLNLRGILALFQNNNQMALEQFHAAVVADPGNVVAVLNEAFVDIQVNRYQEAVEHMRRITALQPPPNDVLLATAYMTWGAALFGLRDIRGADQMLAKAIEINPRSSAGYQLWADVKRESGDPDTAKRFRRLALEQSGQFENYAEVAALWFQLSWRDDQAVIRNQFNPLLLQFNE